MDENIILKYWRTKDMAEVDIVIDQCPIPVDAEYHILTEPKISQAYHNFIKIYRPAFGLIVSRGGEFEKKVEDTMVYFRTIKSLRQTLVENL
jgi:predicted AAA+ superfamily ATPase